jgi:ankyrin repeat protein
MKLQGLYEPENMNPIKSLFTPDGIFQKNIDTGSALFILAVITVGYGISYVRYLNCEGKDNQILYNAIESQNLNEVQQLLNAGRDPNSTTRCTINDDDGFQLVNQPQDELPVFFAVQHGSPEMVTALLTAGADPNRTGKASLPPLMEAIYEAKYDHVAALLAGGANPNWQDVTSGETPLIATAKLNQTRNVQALLNAGAKVNDTDTQGKTALEYAEAGSDIADMLSR